MQGSYLDTNNWDDENKGEKSSPWIWTNGLLNMKHTKDTRSFFFTFYFSECADTVQFRTAGLSEKVFLGFIFPAVRFEPGTAGYEARTLPLCYAVPPSQLEMEVTSEGVGMQLLQLQPPASDTTYLDVAIMVALITWFVPSPR